MELMVYIPKLSHKKKPYLSSISNSCTLILLGDLASTKSISLFWTILDEWWLTITKLLDIPKLHFWLKIDHGKKKKKKESYSIFLILECWYLFNILLQNWASWREIMGATPSVLEGNSNQGRSFLCVRTSCKPHF